MNNARKKIAAGCMAVLLSMTSVYSVCAAETGIEAAAVFQPEPKLPS